MTPRVSLSSVQDLYHRVKAAYAEVSHTLTEQKRRSYRIRIAQMAAIIRQVRRRQEYFGSPSYIQAAVSLAMARADSAASVIADLVRSG
jgi:hypothetical protein